MDLRRHRGLTARAGAPDILWRRWMRSIAAFLVRRNGRSPAPGIRVDRNAPAISHRSSPWRVIGLSEFLFPGSHRRAWRRRSKGRRRAWQTTGRRVLPACVAIASRKVTGGFTQAAAFSGPRSSLALVALIE